MQQTVLPTKLLAASSLAEFSYTLLECYLAPCEGVRSVWITLKGELSTPPRMIACLQRDGREVHIKTESILPLLLPIEISRLQYLPQAYPQTFHLAQSEYPLTLIPIIARSQCFGHLIIRWKSAPEEEQLRTLFASISAVAPLLYGLHRESLFADLERGKQQWEATFDSMRDLLFIYDREGRLLRVNKALAERLESSPREVMLKSQKFQKHFAEVREAYLHSPIWHSHSLDSTFEVTCGQVFDRQQSLIGTVYLLRDITDKVKMEMQIRQSEKLAELGEMVSYIAHELNQRLTSIVGFAELLEKSKLSISEEMQNRVHKIATEADRAEMFVKNLLSFVRPQTPVQKPLSLNRVVERVADLRTEHLENHRVTLNLSLADSLPLIKGCPHEMEQVLLNMVDNALHSVNSHRRDGSITIATCYNGGDTLTVSVTDDGAGIRPELRDKIHLPFFTTKRAGEGSGLGLAISYGILRSCGATLKIHSNVGHGATFAMEFPICSLPLKAGEDAELGGCKNKLPRPNRRGLRLAVLDDDEAVLGLLGDMLRELGHTSTLFETPKGMLEALESQTFDLILSDVWMPEMSGIELHHELTQRFPDYAHRMVFLTGDALPPETRDSLEEYGCRFIDKPFHLEDLQESINATVRPDKSVHRAA